LLPPFNYGGMFFLGTRNKSNRKFNKKWLITVTIWSMIICGAFSLLSDMLLRRVNLLVAFIILIIIILIGILFDLIGVAVTVAIEIPFHSMSSKKNKEAKTAIKLIRNADKVSSFCCDVIGDVCGIVSGSIGFFIAAEVFLIFPKFNATIISTAIGVFIGALTIGGKSIGKTISLNNANEIIIKVCKFIHIFKKER